MTPRPRRGLAAAAAGVAGLALLTACGADPAPPSGSGLPTEVTLSPGPDGVQAVEIDAGDDFRFHPSLVHARVGTIQLTLKHTGQGAPHTLYGEQVPGMRVPLVRRAESRSIRFRAGQPGDYRFVCTIHEAQGETGKLLVSE